jgi:broad specificity phosphatase PhoE
VADAHRIWLVRHGETEWSRSGQHTGRTDIPLTATGEQQGQALGRSLAGRPFALVLTSPLARARRAGSPATPTSRR